jgi:hypothetical protein
MRAFIPLVAAALGVIVVAAPGTAQAASTPAASVVLARHHIVSGTRPGLTYLTAGLPAGSVTYLEVRRAGAGHGWADDRRLGTAGTVTAPAIPAGVYLFRVVAIRAGHTVVASSGTRLTVAPARHSKPAGAPAPGSSPSSYAWLGQAALLVLGFLLGG